MKKIEFKYLDIRWVDLDPTVGAETKKKRPCVILQSDFINPNSRTTIVAPLLPRHFDWPFVVNIFPSKQNGLDKDRHLQLKQLRIVDVLRIKNLNGRLEEKYVEQINEALKLVLNLEQNIIH